MSAQNSSPSFSLRTVVRFATSLALLAGLSLSAAPRASAQDGGINLSPRAAANDSAQQDASKLNRPLLIVGAVLFAGSYAPSAAFAALGDWNADKALFVPVAGPWLALADPDNKPLSKALLINSGVMQGVGAASMLLSLVLPSFDSDTTVRFGKSELQFAPTQLSRDGYGIGAAGSF